MKDCAVIDAEGFASYLDQIEELRLTDDFFDAILPEKYSATTLRTAPYLAYIAAQCASGDPALYSDEMTVADLYSQKADSYQILPKTYLEKCGFKTRETYGQTANVAYVPKEIKTIVRKKSPADYKDLLLEKISEDTIENTLKANAIPANLFEVGDKEVESFLLERRKLMAAKVKDYYFSFK